MEDTLRNRLDAVLLLLCLLLGVTVWTAFFSLGLIVTVSGLIIGGILAKVVFDLTAQYAR